MTPSRRDVLGMLAAAPLLACRKPASTNAVVAKAAAGFPEKAADLVLLTDRPPNLETPLRYFLNDVTPNDAFFVRWHVAGVPTSINMRTYRLNVTGHVTTPLALTLDDLKRFDPVTTIAVNQCSGNSRSFSAPRVPGVQWAHGALGNARWKGARLKDVLTKAGVKAGAVEVAFSGLDRPMLSVPAFVKSLGIDHATDGEVLVAYEMNDAPLPVLNGFPVRLIVPGWYSTYWIKSLEAIDVRPEPFAGYWMSKAYRVPKSEDAGESPGALATDTVPISRMNVRSLMVRPTQNELVTVKQPVALEGIAFDAGTGITRVEVSADGGKSWREAKLDDDLGKYSFRRWRASWTPSATGPAALLVRATAGSGEVQRATPIWNRGGYMRNVYERVDVIVRGT